MIMKLWKMAVKGRAANRTVRTVHDPPVYDARRSPGQIRPALFLHIHKTAGTSIQETARAVYGNDNVISHADYLEMEPGEIARKPFVSGHFGVAFARHHMPGRYCFTFLRDPEERLLSYYRHVRKRGEAGEDEGPGATCLDLDEFLERGLDGQYRAHLWNTQVWQLASGRNVATSGEAFIGIGDIPPDQLLAMAIRNLEAFHRVGFVETYDNDITEIFAALGARVAPKIRRVNVTRDPSSAEPISRQVREMLRDLTRLDRLLYDHAWNTIALPRMGSGCGKINSAS